MTVLVVVHLVVSTATEWIFYTNSDSSQVLIADIHQVADDRVLGISSDGPVH